MGLKSPPKSKGTIKDTQHNRAEKEFLLDKKRKRDRSYRTTNELTGILGNTLSRQAIWKSFRLLQAGNETLGEVVMEEIKSSTPSLQTTTIRSDEEQEVITNDNDARAQQVIALYQHPAFF